MNVHKDADVGLSHGVENQTRDGLGEEGVVGLGGEHALPGTLQHHTTFSPPRVTTQGIIHTEKYICTLPGKCVPMQQKWILFIYVLYGFTCISNYE